MKTTSKSRRTDIKRDLTLSQALLEALKCWGAHDAGCPGRTEGPDFCTCGLDAARGGA